MFALVGDVEVVDDRDVRPAATANHVAISIPSREAIVAGTATQCVPALVVEELVSIGAASGDVVAPAREDVVLAVATDRLVGGPAAVKQVVVDAAEKRVVSCAAMEVVVAGVAVDPVVAGEPDERVPALVTRQGVVSPVAGLGTGGAAGPGCLALPEQPRRDRVAGSPVVHGGVEGVVSGIAAGDVVVLRPDVRDAAVPEHPVAALDVVVPVPVV